MKRFKKLVVIILAVFLVSNIAGCSKDDIISKISDVAGEETAEQISGLIDVMDDIGDRAESTIDGVVRDLTGNSEGQNSLDGEVASERYYFRNSKLLNQHFEKHGIDMGFASAGDYELAASNVINDPRALFKVEEEDGDYCFYIEETNEFAVLSTDGYIRTYFCPDAGKAYFDRQ